MDEDDDDMVGWEDDVGADADPDADADGEDIAWEDAHDNDEDGDGEDDDDGRQGGGRTTRSDDDAFAGGADEHDEDQDEEPEERRWLGDNGEIVVELPREDESEDGLHEAQPGDGDSDGDGKGKGKGKQKAKIRRFTADENRQALNVHKTHLSCLVARCAVVSRWAGDPSVQAAMVSCLPIELLPRRPVPVEAVPNSLGGRGELEVAPKQPEGLTLAVLVVWFREFLTVLDDGAVGGGGEGSWGSRPSRLLRVIDQRVGCAQEAVQLFVALCRGLGLRARYVSCLDPLPPFPRSLRPTKQTRNNTVDLVAAEGRRGRHRQSGGQAGAALVGSQAWAEVLCRDGESLRVVTGASRADGRPPTPRPLKRRRTEPSKTLSISGGGTSAEPLLLDDNDDDVQDATSRRGSQSGIDESVRGNYDGGAGSGKSGPRGGGGEKSAAAEGQESATDEMEAASTGAGEVAVEPPRAPADKHPSGKTARGKGRRSDAGEAPVTAAATTKISEAVAGGDKAHTTLSQVTASPPQIKTDGTGLRMAKRRSPRGRPPQEQSAEAPATSNVSNVGGGGGSGRGRGSGSSGGGGSSGGSSGSCSGGGSSETTSARPAIESEMEVSMDGGVAATGAEIGLEPGERHGKTAGVGGAGSVVTSAGERERWVHVDPVLGAVDQPEKVQGLRFRKQLMPYVVAEDERRAIVDVTRRYSSQWSRTLRTRGRAMASQDGWWNLALRQWGASSVRGASKDRKDRSGRPLSVGGGGANAGGQCASEEKELREKVNSEPVPTTIAGLKDHHVYVLGKSLLKFEGLRPGAKVAGLVKGCKVYSRSDIAKLRGASRWKQDGLKVKESELEKPAKVTTKKGEKDGEGTSKLYGDWQTEPWVPEAVANGKVPKNEHGNVEFFDCCPAFLPPGAEHVRGDQIGRVAAKLGVDYAPALTGFETKQGRHVPVLDGIIVCKEQSQMLRDAHTAWEQTLLEKQVRARGQKVLRRWSTLFRGVLLGAKLLEEYGDHD